MLIVAPIGNTKRETLGSIPLLFSRLEIVTGKVAELEAVANAVNKACDIPLRNRIKSLNGSYEISLFPVHCLESPQ